MLPWEDIDTVLLDMDGTLLDLHYDNHFWRKHVPMRYAEQNGITIEESMNEIKARYVVAEGTLNWYCVDYWTKELGLDIASLKQEVDYLISVFPYVVDFLVALRSKQKRIVLVTNAHGKALKLKMDRTQLRGHFDNLICAHDLGLPKEHAPFWEKLQAFETFEKIRTLLIDDSLPVLRSARDYGIRHLLGILNPDSRGPVKDVEEFNAIRSFREIMPV